MKFYVGNTDLSWFRYLRDLDPPPEDINFWKPSDANFKAVPFGAPFMLKLKSPVNKIAGVGFFAGYTRLPLSLAWETFGNRNGCETFDQLKKLITAYRASMGHKPVLDPEIGCIALTSPIFFHESEYIDAPSNWANSIVSGKVYDDREPIGEGIWAQVAVRLNNRIPRQAMQDEATIASPMMTAEEEPALWSGYSGFAQTKIRIGQGAFRLMVTNAYDRRCAVTGEGLVTVLDAAHIQDFSQQGPNLESNGLLLRKDIHKLFDEGIMTITPSHHIEISNEIRHQYEHSSEYIKFHGQPLHQLPKALHHHPAKKYLSWHNENRFRG
jgi:putative restriction endonuclease